MIHIITIVNRFVLPLYLALAVSYMWGWFMVPFGFMDIGFAHSIGMILFLELLMFRIPSRSSLLTGIDKEEAMDESEKLRAEGWWVFLYLLSVSIGWFGGWICHLYM